MTIWAFSASDDAQQREFVQSCLDRGQSRFGWGYTPGADLRELEPKPYAEMDDAEKNCWHKAGFLLGVKAGDWIVHVNMPSQGKCTASIVTGEYFFEWDPTVGDFGHGFPIDQHAKVVFERNDDRVHPRVSRALKPRGRYQRVNYGSEFVESIERLRDGSLTLAENDTRGRFYLRKEILGPLRNITELVHRNHPSKDLEYFVCEIFRHVPGVEKAYVNGSGWKSDYGADVVVHYRVGLPIANLQREEILVVQVKSYDFNLDSELAIDQLKTALEKFKARAGMILCTAKPTDGFLERFEEFSKHSDAPVCLIAGEDVAKFVLRYGNDLLFDF